MASNNFPKTTEKYFHCSCDLCYIIPPIIQKKCCKEVEIIKKIINKCKLHYPLTELQQAMSGHRGTDVQSYTCWCSNRHKKTVSEFSETFCCKNIQQIYCKNG